MNDNLCSCGKYNKAKGLRYCSNCANTIKKALEEKEANGTINVRVVGGRKVTVYI